MSAETGGGFDAIEQTFLAKPQRDSLAFDAVHSVYMRRLQPLSFRILLK